MIKLKCCKWYECNQWEKKTTFLRNIIDHYQLNKLYKKLTIKSSVYYTQLFNLENGMRQHSFINQKLLVLVFWWP